MTIAAPHGLQEYTYVMVGTLDATTSPLVAPRFTFRPLLSPDSLVATLWPLAFQAPVPPSVADGSFTVVARRRRVLCEGTPVYVEARWHPTEGETLALRGLERDTRKGSIDKAYRGIKLLKEIEALGGRPEGTRTYSRDEWFAKYPRAAAEAKRRRDSRIRDEDIARALAVSLSSFYRYVKKYGRPALS